ncbi:MAG: carboxypeptidase-like regulatory domain-containing protein, partial [Chitinophagaceae bacterium]
MRKFFPFLFVFLFPVLTYAGTISGIIKDVKGTALPYASVSIKGTTRGTTANSSGRYSLTLAPGQYTLVAQYVGYTKMEKTVTVTEAGQSVDFELAVQELTLGEVIVKKGEDPAYEIIRQAIKKRNYYNDQVDSFSVMVYIKGLLRSGSMPKKLFGQKIEREEGDGLDSLGKGILYLSESLTQVDYSKPNKIKYKVISSRESGGGYGFSFPFFINFYQNNVSVFGNNLNPRGFISPVADGALNYYKFKYEGFFMEDGKMVNTIRVTPRRKNEPLFSGVIQVTEDDWRIYSTDLIAVKSQGLEMLDTLRITQIHSAVNAEVWKTKNQVLQLDLKQFGFHVTGSFVNVYSDYNINPGFGKKHFGRTFMKYDTAFNKKDTNYWNALRPVALENDEKQNFVFRDSVSRI